MALDKTKLNPIGGVSRRGKAPAIWTYITEDVATTVDGAGYFNQVSGMLSTGDLIFATTTLSGVPTEVGIHVVMGNNGGIVDVSNVIDLTATAISNAD